ncbi:Lsr2 family DNA-binding protein [Streptomyces crystallinus]|uniref:Lsr2 DNA-binding domain-containing protein n=1 Tax=Streptomyces crystallinus TaxID=68191 RepID=A0ABP3Q5B1_9ACTN
MASSRRTVIDYTDDMTGLPIPEDLVDNFCFSIDGVDFKMDTDTALANEIRELLARATANAEIAYWKPKVVEPAKAPRKKTNPERSRLLKKIRFWANENGKKVAPQGRIPEDVVTSYRTANPGVDMTPYDNS